MPQSITRRSGRWRRRPRTTRIVISIGIPAGFAFFVLGLWLDSIDWWTHHGYVLNIFSGLTSACFGVPFALVGLDYLIRKQEEHREAERLRERAAVATGRFVGDLLRIFHGRTLTDVSERVRALLAKALAVYTVRRGGPASKERERQLLATFGELLPGSGGRPHETWSSFPHHSNEARDMGTWRTAVQTSWNRLAGVTAQMADEWIDRATENAAQEAVAHLLMSGRSPWKVTSDFENHAFPAMRNFLRDLDALCKAATALEAHARSEGFR